MKETMENVRRTEVEKKNQRKERKKKIRKAVSWM
jgi:hypothetical protein